MSLFDIAIKNIKRNFQNYFLYFVSMTFSIMIYYTFVSIQYNKQVIDLTKASLKADAAFRAGSIVIAVFAAMFIWYSNAFFTKKRKKEVALYCMLGVKRKQVSRMLFYENIVMGAAALLCGITIGSMFSTLFTMILVKLMSFEVNIKFSISILAIRNTIIVFMILFIIAALHSYTLIYRFKLIELFKAESTGQKKPKASVVLSLLAVAFIGIGYYLALNFKFTANLFIDLLEILIITVLGTYLLFTSLMVFAVKLGKVNKKSYYRGINMIGTSHLQHRIKSNGRSLATIAVLSATTITAMGTAACLYYDNITAINNANPFSYVYESKSKSVDTKVDALVKASTSNKLKASIDIKLVSLHDKAPNLSKMNSNSGKYGEYADMIISHTEANKVLKQRGLSQDINIKEDETYVFLNDYYEKIMESPEGKNLYLTIDGQEKAFKINGFYKTQLINYSLGNSGQAIYVVSDQVYNRIRTKDNESTKRLIDVENQSHSKALTENITKVLRDSGLYNEVDLGISSYYSYYTKFMAVYGMLVFLAFFLGFVFLICTGSIIFFKQLSEANEDKDRYTILKKIGVKNSEMRGSIAKQILVVFMLPLCLGVLHSIVALKILQPILHSNMLYPELLTVGIYTVIYFIYYIATVDSYQKTVTAS